MAVGSDATILGRLNQAILGGNHLGVCESIDIPFILQLHPSMNAIGGQAARTVGGRALAVNIFPSPTNLAESREVLRILQSYGEVTTYKLFKHEKYNFAENRGLVIFRDEAYAEAFHKACPLYFTLERVVKDDDGASLDPSSSTTLSENAPAAPTSKADPNPASSSADASNLLFQPSRKELSTQSPSFVPPTPSDTSKLASSSTYAPELTSPPRLLFQPDQPTAPKTTPKSPPPMPFEPLPSQSTEKKQFRITSTAWIGNHREFLAGTKFWGPFIHRQSAVQADLLRRLGQSMSQKEGGTANLGLSDTDPWGHPDGVPEKTRRKRMEEGWKGTLRAVLSNQGRENKDEWGSDKDIGMGLEERM